MTASLKSMQSLTNKRVLTIFTCFLMAGAGWFTWTWWTSQKPIKVGLLHSLSGPMAISERSMVDAEVMALEELNATGGLLKRKIEWVIADGKSDWPTFAREAERLIQKEKVDVIIGCWTSASRKTVLPVIESNKHLLIYPMAYEGLEQSPNIIYTGSAPNQQIIPAVAWAMRELKAKRYYLVGSDYIWPHCVNEIAKDTIDSIGGELAGENYLFFGTNKVEAVVDDIIATKPDVIISTVVGDTNKAFYRAMDEAGLSAEKLPVISFAIAEDELLSILKEVPSKALVGHYSAWNYFQTIDRQENRSFVDRLHKRYGKERSASDVMTASYNSVFFWAQAVREAETTRIIDVTHAMSHQSLDAPEGIVSIDAENHHIWRPVYIGKVRSDAQFDIVWSSESSIRPEPYPLTRTHNDWEMLLEKLYQGWGNTWSNPQENKIISKRQSLLTNPKEVIPLESRVTPIPSKPKVELKPDLKPPEILNPKDIQKKPLDSPPVPTPVGKPETKPSVKPVSIVPPLKPFNPPDKPAKAGSSTDSKMIPKTDFSIQKI
jgi:urea transport system substrate-binding protein